MREHEPRNPGERPELTAGAEVPQRVFLRQIAATERAMVASTRSTERIKRIQGDCQVSERRARRLIRAVNQLWHYRARAFGTPARARTKILPLVQEVFERALAKDNLGSALQALRLQADLLGLSKADVAALPLGDEAELTEEMNEKAAEVADRVLERLFSRGGSNPTAEQTKQ